MVVPAEIGHAQYAAPVIDYLTRRFSRVRAIASRDQIFPELSQDAWLLLGEGYGTADNRIEIVRADRFEADLCDRDGERVGEGELRVWTNRLRPFLLPADVRTHYQQLVTCKRAFRFGDAARCGIGYVTGANDFFHLRPSDAERLRIPSQCLIPSVRNGRQLPENRLSATHVKKWYRDDDAHLLLRLTKGSELPLTVKKYLETAQATEVKASYKCRMRTPWYVVPDVRVPNAFLTYMNGLAVTLVKNSARCTCTNSVHAVRMNIGWKFSDVADRWDSEVRELSAEVEGHPLGGGMLKLEPTEAVRLVIPGKEFRLQKPEKQRLNDAIDTMRQWRHYGGSTKVVEHCR